MTKADIYALYVEVCHKFFNVFEEVIRSESVSLYKEEVFREKIKISELDIKSTLFEIECYENSRDEKNRTFKIKLFLLFLLSVVSFILNPFLGIGVTYFSFKKARNMYEDAKFDCQGPNLKKVKWHLNNSLSSLNDCKKHIDTLAEERDLQLEQERIKNKGVLDIDSANMVLGEYLLTEELPEMSDEVRWTLIKMLREDLKTDEWNLDRLLDMVMDATPIGLIEKGESRRRKKKGVDYE